MANLLLKQQALMANKGKIRIRRPKKWLYPMPVERAYIKEVQAINKVFWSKVRDNIIPNLPMLVAQAQSIRPDDNGERIDAQWVDHLKQLIEKTLYDFDKVVGKPKISAISAEQAAKLSMFNKSQFVKVIHSSLAVNPIVQETWLEPQMKAFTQQNVDLITNLSVEQNARVQQTIYRNLSAGNGIDAIKKELDKDESIGKSRSKLIARDQTNKFNGQLTQMRQQEVGIGSYIWSSARDERVRPEHAALDGKTIKWSEPPSIGHAGQPIQCRCIAQPIITDAMFDGTGEIEASAYATTKESTINQESNLEVKSSFSKIVYTDKFNQSEFEAIKEYQLGDISKGAKFGGYDGINGYLRTGEIPDKVKSKFDITKSEMESVVKKIDSSFSKSVVKSDFVVYRGMRNGDRVLNLGVGGVYNDKAYVSTSKNLAAAKKFSDGVGKNSIIMKINVSKGNEALTMNDFSDKAGHLKRENEILLPRNQKFKIKSINTIDKFLTEVEFEII